MSAVLVAGLLLFGFGLGGLAAVLAMCVLERRRRRRTPQKHRVLHGLSSEPILEYPCIVHEFGGRQ